MSAVQDFERAFADYVGVRHAIALCNGTATLHTALAALGVGFGDRVAVPPLTMSSTTIAVLHAGGVPVFVDVDPDTWLVGIGAPDIPVQMPVDLYGLHSDMNDWRDGGRMAGRRDFVKDSAQTLRPHGTDRTGWPEFTSYSFQASKILPLGEGGMLVTNDDELAVRAREFSSLGYRMGADEPRICKAALKRPDYARHHSLGWNYRMSDLAAGGGLRALTGGVTSRYVDALRLARQEAAFVYEDVIAGCPWTTPQHVPEGWTHDYWCYAVALESAELWHPFVDAIERHGGERPYAAWKLTYQEPAFRHLAEDGTCPVAEDLQPRLVQFQTNDLQQAQRNADAVAAAIREIG